MQRSSRPLEATVHRGIKTIGQKILTEALEPYAIPVYTSHILVIKKVQKRLRRKEGRRHAEKENK